MKIPRLTKLRINVKASRLALSFFMAAFSTGCGQSATPKQENVADSSFDKSQVAEASPATNHESSAEVKFTLVSGAEVGPGEKAYFTAGNGHHGFFGRGGAIDGKPNPTLTVRQGEKVSITLLDLDQRGQPAQLAVPAFHVATPTLTNYGKSASITFTADRAGAFNYTGQIAFGGEHNHQHMIGKILVTPK